MANQLAANPFKIDTKSDTPIYLPYMNIMRIDYINYATANDAAEVQDENGNIIWVARGNPDLSTVEGHDFGWYTGLKVPLLRTDGNPNMPNGLLLIHFE
jgi:hypothetical protein